MSLTLPQIGLLVLAAVCGVSCTNADGRFRPPDPIGYAIFEALDRRIYNTPSRRYSERPAYRDTEYLDYPNEAAARRNPPSRNSIWVDGTYGVSNGRRVWIPAHWQ